MSRPAGALEVTRPQDLGAELAICLRAVIAGGPGFPHAGLAGDRLAGERRRGVDEADRLTSLVRVPPNKAVHVVGRTGVGGAHILGPLAERAGARQGVRVSLEIMAA